MLLNIDTEGGYLMSSQDEVRKASTAFYEALNLMLNGDAGPLSDIWSHGSDVTTLHPTGGRQVGWGEVWESWNQVAQLSTDGKVLLKDQLVHVVGELAYEVGVEHAEFKLAGEKVSGRMRVTNIYQREGGAWKIRHHHTDLAPEIVEALNNLQSPFGTD